MTRGVGRGAGTTHKEVTKVVGRGDLSSGKGGRNWRRGSRDYTQRTEVTRGVARGAGTTHKELR